MDYTLKAKGLYIEITSYCNRNCPYCYNDSSINSNTVLNKKTIFNLIDSVTNKRITISGGEPFSHPSIYEIIDYANNRNVLLHIVTNLSMVSKEKIIDILKRGNSIQITLDSLIKVENDKTRGMGSYDSVVSIIKALSQSQYKELIKLRFNLSKKNIKEIDDVINFAIKNKLNNIELAFLVNSGRGKNYSLLFDYSNDLVEINKVIQQLRVLKNKNSDLLDISYSTIDKQKGCVLYKNGEIPIVPRIDSKGDVFACQLFFGPECVLGNIKNNTLNEIISSSKAYDFVEKIRKRKGYNKDCSKCFFSEGCMCGCPAMSLLNTDELMNKDDQCNMIKFFYKEKLKQYNE